MRRIGIRQLRNNLSEELEDLPFVVTKHGKIIAEVSKSGRKEIKKEKTVPEIKLCKHGSLPSLCRFTECR